jgi:lipocalin
MFEEIKNSYIRIALNHENLTVEYMGTETFENSEYNVINIEGDKTITFLLDKETHLPFLSRKNDLNPQTGSFVTSETRYSNWTTVDGVSYAFLTTSYADGEKVSETVVESITVN